MPKPPVAPVVWQPPRAGARARQRTSSPPLPPLRILSLPSAGPEDVVVDGSGRIFTGTEDGKILRLDHDTGQVETVTQTQGRPLGVELLDDALLVCDAYRGLLRVDLAGGGVDVLCDEVDGRPLTICNNAAVSRNGTIFFSDSSQRFTLEHWRADLVEHSGTGRLLRREPGGDTDVLLEGLQFANGVALAPDESFVAVAESGGYRLQRVWLAGDRAGSVDTLIDNLPGFPDNISTGTDGLIWIAIGSPRNPVLDWLHARPPVLRRAVWSLPDSLQPAPVKTAWVMAVNSEGRVVHDLQRTDATMHLVTGVRKSNGRVYLGSLVAPAVAWFELPAA